MWYHLMKITEVVSVSLLGFLFLTNFVQVIRRYVFGSSFVWIEEISRVLLVWLVCLGMTLVARGEGHLSLDYFVEKLPKRLKLPVAVASGALIVIFCGVMTIWGWKITARTQFHLPATSLNAQWSYLAIPVGFFLLSLGTILRMFDLIWRRQNVKDVQKTASRVKDLEDSQSGEDKLFSA